MTVTEHQASADLYLRLSDFRRDDDGSFPAREAKLRVKAASLGWRVNRVIVENDVRPDGSRKPASAWKRVKTGRVTENGRPVYRVLRDGWRSVIADLETGRATAVLAEDLDRTCRDMADLLDLLDAVGACGGNARSLSGSLTLTDGGTSDERAMAQMLVTMAGKSSADTSRRVSAGRERWAGISYQGGRRPFGYAVDPDSTQYHRRLLLADSEAGVIRQAAADILDRGISLKAIARKLREDGVPTVTGVPWTATTLRDVLSKQALTGLTDDQGNVVIPAILDTDVHERLTDLFRSRQHPGTGNEPRWLCSGVAACGVCSGPVKCTGTAGRRAYTCTEHGHVRRAAEQTDLHVAARVVALLEREGPELLKPRPKVTADTRGLRAEIRKLNTKRDDLARLLGEEVLTEAGVRAERKRIDARLGELTARLASASEADPLPEFRDPAADVLAVWDGLGVARQRVIVRLLYNVVILPAARKGGRFDPDSVQLTRRTA